MTLLPARGSTACRAKLSTKGSGPPARPSPPGPLSHRTPVPRERGNGISCMALPLVPCGAGHFQLDRGLVFSEGVLRAEGVLVENDPAEGARELAQVEDQGIGRG